MTTNVGHRGDHGQGDGHLSCRRTKRAIKALESPLAIKYKGITITPGGFISANANYRSKNQNLYNFGSFGAIPFSGSQQRALERVSLDRALYPAFAAGARQVRRLTTCRPITKSISKALRRPPTKVITNSFQPRIREAWANVDAASGGSFAGGQTWSLLTANRTGVGPRGLALPSHISASLIVGFHYTRQDGFRVYKKWDLSDKKKVYFAFAVENPETTSAGCDPDRLHHLGPASVPRFRSGNPAPRQQPLRAVIDRHGRLCTVQHLRERPFDRRRA